MDESGVGRWCFTAFAHEYESQGNELGSIEAITHRDV